MDKKILVTGGAGFIGSHVVDELLKNNHQVSVLDLKDKNEATNLAHCIDNINYVSGDIRDTKLINELCEDCDYVIHLAAIVSVPLSVQDPVGTNDNNVNGTLSVFDAAKNNQVKRLVYASSAAVYGENDQVVSKENIKLNPQSPYAIQKLTNEFYGRFYSDNNLLETIGLRYFNVFGSRQDPNSHYSGIIAILQKHFATKTPPTIYGDGQQTRDYVHVSDVVKANLLALTAGKAGEIYNIGTGVETSLNQLLEYFKDITQIQLEPKYDEARAGDILRSCASIKKAEQELGYEPSCDLKEGLKLLLV